MQDRETGEEQAHEHDAAEHASPVARGEVKCNGVNGRPEGLRPAWKRKTGARLRETADRGGFVFVNVEDGIEFRDLEQIPDSLGEVEELQLAAAIRHRGEPGHEFADPRAIDVGHIREVEQDLLVVFGDHVAQGIAHRAGALTQRDASSNIHHRYVANLPSIQLYAH